LTTRFMLFMLRRANLLKSYNEPRFKVIFNIGYW
jgi:hypothetical protein